MDEGSRDNDEGIAIEREDPVACHQNKRFDQGLGHNDAVEGIVVVAREGFHPGGRVREMSRNR